MVSVDGRPSLDWVNVLGIIGLLVGKASQAPDKGVDLSVIVF